MLLRLIMTRAHKLAARLCDPYRPERHYMRGPGPKYRAKHARNAIVPEPGLGGMANASA